MNLPGVLYNRDFLKLWVAQIASQFALNILNFVLLIKVYEATTSNTSVSLLLLAFGVPGLLLGYLAGSYVDSVNTKSVLIITNTVRALVILMLFFLPNSLAGYYVVALIISLASQFFIPAEGSLLPKLVPNDQLLSANCIFTTTLYVMTFVGFLLAGPSLRVFDTEGTALLIAGSFLIALVACWLLPKAERRPVISESLAYVTHIFSGLKFVWKSKEVKHSLFFLTLTQTIFLVIATIAPGFLDKVLKIDVRETSLVLVAPAAIGLLLGAVFLNRLAKTHSPRRLVTSGMLGMGATLVGLTITGLIVSDVYRIALTILLAFFLGVEIALINIPATTSLQMETREDLRGRMYGLLVSLQSGASLLPVILAGAFADLFGVGFVLQGMGFGILGVGVYRLRHRFL